MYSLTDHQTTHNDHPGQETEYYRHPDVPLPFIDHNPIIPPPSLLEETYLWQS